MASASLKIYSPFAGAADGTYFARYGTFAISLKSPAKSFKSLHDSIVDSLKKDSRVAVVDPGSMRPEWTWRDTLYPAVKSADTDVLLSGSDHFHTVRYSDAIMFELHVPGKNQPVIHGEEPKPDVYFVAWDGLTAVVLWERDPKDKHPGPAGGQIVAEVLATAMAGIEQDLYVQACSPNCQHLFAHRDIALSVWKAADYQSDFSSTGMEPVVLKLEGTFRSGLAIAEAVHDEIKMTSADFAKVKNIARRIMDIEQRARSMTFDLIGIDYVRLSRARASFWRRVGSWFAERWQSIRGRGLARRADLLIASLWLAMAGIETLQRAFVDARREFEDSVHEWATPALYEVDLKSDDLAVETMDAQFARAAVENKSSRMDTRVVVWATISGGILGALLGAIGGALVAAALSGGS